MTYAGLWLIAAFAQVPDFSHYPAQVVEIAKPARLRIETPQQIKLEKDLRIAESYPPNFAGRYVFRQMFCGPDCLRIAVIDPASGRIFGSPFGTPAAPFDLPPPNWDPQLPRYQPDSRLLVVPNVCPAPDACGVYFFEWRDEAFHLLVRRPVSAKPVIPESSPLIGAWKGAWSYFNGNEVREEFQIEFLAAPRGGVAVRFRNAKGQRRTVRQVVETKPDRSAYRMEIDHNCWNVSLDSDRGILTGLWNGGPCNAMGIGVGARLIALEAKRVTEARR